MTASATILETPLTITGRGGARSVTFPVPVLLAPMEGVTDRTFRTVVLDLGHAGGACTEFIRISQASVRAKMIRRELGDLRDDVPVGVQLMAPGPDHVPETVAEVESVGARWIDLNFGCPVKRVCGKGAGSALLADPDALGRIVAAAAEATELPVSAKIRAGLDDASLLGEIVDAAVEAGAAMITLHARRRVDSYATAANWEWIAFAAERLAGRIPLVGNGGIDHADRVVPMLEETGCDAVMIGRAALADPFIFGAVRGAPPPTVAEAAALAIRYLDAIQPVAHSRYRLGRFKQLVRTYRAGGIFEGREHERRPLLRAQDAATLRDWFVRAGGR